MNVETGETRTLTQDDQVYADPVFSPDGQRLAYVSTKGTGNFHLFTRAIRGGDWSGPETQLSRENSFGRGRQYFSEQDLHIEPAWMRDGRGLLVVSNRGVALGSGHLWRMPVDGADAMTRARPILTEQSLYRTRPDVAPDGKRLVYSSTAGAADQFNHLICAACGRRAAVQADIRRVRRFPSALVPGRRADRIYLERSRPP